MSNLKHNMAHLYHIIADSKPMKPSNRGSGLGENELSVSLGATSLSETPRSAGDPGPEQQKKKKKKVVVVGAGISGLRCAAVLQRHGIEVVVLEGRDRIGGRIHTTRSEKGVRDIG